MLSRKILHVRSSRSLAGPERHLLELLPGLGGHGFQPEVALLYRRLPGDPEAHPLLALLAARGIPAFQLADPGRLGRAARRALAERLRGGDLAALHGHDPKSDWVISGALRAVTRPGAGGKIARLATHHLYTRGTPALRLHRRIDLRLLRRFDGVIAVTEALAAELAEGLGSRGGVGGGQRPGCRPECRVIPNGIDAERYRLHATEVRAAAGAEPAARSARAPAGRSPMLLAAGRLTRQKGFDLLLEALPAVVARHPGVVLQIAGEGPERTALAARTAKLRLEGQVCFLGERTDLAALGAAADAFVLPSRREGSPYVLLEAMALGLPVVAAAVGGVPAMLGDGAGGLLSRPGDPAALAGAILRLLELPEEARGRAEVARRAVAGPLSADRMAEATAAFYVELLE